MVKRYGPTDDPAVSVTDCCFEQCHCFAFFFFQSTLFIYYYFFAGGGKGSAFVPVIQLSPMCMTARGSPIWT